MSTAPAAAPQTDRLARSAAWYARRCGWPVLPLWWIERGHCACPRGPGCAEKPGKHPVYARGVLERGLTDATRDVQVIRGWWQRWPAANIGVAVPAGYVVVDIDGAEGWGALEAEGLSLPATLTAITGRGEWHRHLWYRLPDGVTVRPKVGLLEHVDIRALGSYVVAPPSMTVGDYHWLDRFDLGTIAEAPSWLLERITSSSGAPVAKASGWWREHLAEVASGCRNDTITRLAGHLLRHNVNLEAVEALVLSLNASRCRPPLDNAEVLAILASVWRTRDVHQRGGTP